MSMIEFQHLTKVFEGKTEVHALHDVSLSIEKGDIYGIIGYSGAGKSTLVRMINALELPTSGKVLVDGQDLSALNEKELRTLRKSIGMIFQQFNLLNSKTIYDNVAIPLRLNGVPKAEIEKRVNELLQFVGLSEKKKAYPDQLSGGQKQRVGIARALATNPKILLCDEATSALDPKTTESILALLKKINEEMGVTIVVITHEMNVIRQICNKVAVMDYGKVVESGQVVDVFTNPKSTIAKEFVGNLIHDEVPAPLIPAIRAMTTNYQILRIKMQNHEHTEPLLWELNTKYQVKTNLLYCTINVIEGVVIGIMLILFEGSNEEIEKCKTHIIETGEEFEEVML